MHLQPEDLCHKAADIPGRCQIVANPPDLLRLIRPVAPALGELRVPPVTLPLLEVRIPPKTLAYLIALLPSLFLMALGLLGLLRCLLGSNDALQGLA